MGMKTLLLKTAVAMLRGVYAPVKLFPVRRKIVFISRQSNRLGLDFFMLQNQIRQQDPKIKTVMLIRMIPSSLLMCISYGFHILIQMYHIATSQVVILDGYCITACVLKHKEQTKIIQMWHSMAAIKKFGYQTIGKKDGADQEVAKIMQMHRNYDYVLSPGGKTDDHFCEAFDIPRNKLIHLSLPRADRIMNPEPETAIRIRSEYALDGSIPVVLYVPTFRRNGSVQLKNIVEQFDFQNNILVIKLHPLDYENSLEERARYREQKNMIIDTTFDSYAWLDICDKIITDYSALGIESTLTDKPLYFYLYDLKEYTKTVGLNIDLHQEMGPYAVDTAEELMQVMDQPYQHAYLQKFRERYLSSVTDDCTAEITSFVLGLLS